MNKRTMIVIFSAVIIVLLIVLIWGISVRDGWNGWGWESPRRSSAGLDSGTMFEYPAADVRSLDLDLLSEDVIIEPADGAVVRVEQTSGVEIPAEYRVYSGLQGDTLVVQRSRRSLASCGFNNPYHSTIRIAVPEEVLLQLNIDILSGDVGIRNLEFRDVDIDAASGSVSLDSVSAEDMFAETASGSVQIEAGTFSSLRCETASGSIDIDADVAGKAVISSLSGGQRFTGTCSDFDVDTASGDIDAELRGTSAIDAEAMSGSITLKCADVSRLRLVDVETASGTVTLTVPAGTALSLDYETMSGDLNLDEQSVLLSGSGIEVNVETASGDFHIRSEGRNRSS